MDRIVLAGLDVWAHHGVLPHETVHGQRFVVDATIELDLSAAARTDDLDQTLDYGVLARRIHDTVAAGPRKLIEAVAGDVLDVLLADERVEAAEVTVHKPAAPLPVPARDVAVTLRRTRT